MFSRAARNAASSARMRAGPRLGETHPTRQAAPIRLRFPGKRTRRTLCGAGISIFRLDAAALPPSRAAIAADAPAGPPPRIGDHVFTRIRRSCRTPIRTSAAPVGLVIAVLPRLREAFDRARAARQIARARTERRLGVRKLAGAHREFADALRPPGADNRAARYSAACAARSTQIRSAFIACFVLSFCRQKVPFELLPRDQQFGRRLVSSPVRRSPSELASICRTCSRGRGGVALARFGDAHGPMPPRLLARPIVNRQRIAIQNLVPVSR